MQFAMLGDLHSSINDTQSVLNHIKEIAPSSEIIGLGDLYECVISKTRITERFNSINDVMARPNGFEELLTFPSVRGNQEERIEIIMSGKDPLLEQIVQYPEVIEIPGAKVIHGHQWEWSGNPWLPFIPFEHNELVFFGHSHRSAYYMDGDWKVPQFGITYEFKGKKAGINVGSVIDNREWVLFDSDTQSVTFQKAK
ncbi:metallophosphoesterase family protein [Chungangia koreensis]|uniref:Metallophosphoesterase family protein n=1 Tax=Chungangia koreensis TaxID=752657 RepID=A0ABV8X7C1_9LACT